MNFLNETLHPKAKALLTVIGAAWDDYDNGGKEEEPTFYVTLEAWRKIEGLTDEKTADLYARLQESLGPYGGLTNETYISKISKALWQNERVYP